MTPDDYDRRARELDAEAEQLARAGHIKESVARGIEAEHLRRAAAEMRGLQGRNQRGSVGRMVNAARVRISAGADQHPDELVAKANAAGYTLRSLAEAVDCSHALLSQARRGHRSIARVVVDDIERLTGFKATNANWPGGIRD